MDAFEVSSTYRQFDEVLQLGRNARTRPLLERLWHAVQRHRTSGLIAADDESDRSDAAVRAAAAARYLDPAWDRSDIPDLTIHARMGNVLSISGTDRTMQALLKDRSSSRSKRAAGRATRLRPLTPIHQRSGWLPDQRRDRPYTRRRARTRRHHRRRH